MSLGTRKEQDIVIITITGKMDAITSPSIENKLTELVDAGERKLVFDFQGLDYISSAGLRGILATAKKLKAEKGDIVFANIRGYVAEVFKMSGFHSLFRIFDSVDAAMNDLRKIG